ncbi:hypothetical protein QYM36_004158 [Artemia franciscana]|uniref:AAA+ ATPase domain-containing protein n=1 Tax=Artemia franciscana TaxID=6661 RepID=A0AA88L6D5_ARTSF|nr:hypothetical protein QYM36_004158 [Artemia franciscana]
MDFPDDEDILAEEQFMQEYNNFPDDIPFEDEPPSLEDIIKPLKKLTERQVQNVPEKAKETERLSRKRLQDDLFGDLDGLEDSILEEVIENYSDAKRPKVSQPSTVTSAKTADALENLFGRSSPVKSPSPIDHDSYLDRLEAIISTKNAARKNAKSELPLLRRRKYAFRTLPDVPFLSMTNEKGERMYMLLKDQEQRHISDVKSHKPGTLLGVSISVLKLQLEKEKERKEKEKKEALEKRLESFGNLEFRKRKRHKENKVESGDSSWLESYRPRKYFDLLSHEATNRALLRWLKLWDKVVFNREVKIRPRLQDGSAVAEDQTQRNQYQGGNKFQKKFVTTDESVIQELDDKGKPIQKVALLCGPPGLGKTTLAHVVATHAGYNVVEMNASDDRTVEAFKLQLETATQMKSVVSSDPRPNCLIIDEIDGAPSAAVNFLISHLQAQDGDKQKGKKKKGSPKVLQRPIICICNDLYAPSLRQLRAVALILSFPPTESSRLANRLLEISQEHDIQTDLATLLALCEKAENDIRSCLATLYFFRLQGKSFRLQNVLNSNVGAKDSKMARKVKGPKEMGLMWMDLSTRLISEGSDVRKRWVRKIRKLMGPKEMGLMWIELFIRLISDVSDV